MAMKTKFYVGDRVRVVDVQDALYESVGKEGTVVRVYHQENGMPDNVVVRFDERFSDRLHSGRIGDTTRCCWNILDDKLTFVLSPISFEDVADLL